MEHRCGTRQTILTATTLYSRFGSPAAGRLRDVSISGMFVEVAASHLPPRSLVEIELTVVSARGSRTYRCPGMVVRVTEDGVGLMFDRLNPPAVARLLTAGDRPAAQPLRPSLRAKPAGGLLADEPTRISTV